MSIFGVGTDVVAIARISQAIERHGDKFAARLLCMVEWQEYRERQPKAAFFLAKRFAAKEAIGKALGTGIGVRLGFHDMIITHEEAGRPQVELSQAGQIICNQLRVGAIHLSISDERYYAIAFAVAENSNT